MIHGLPERLQSLRMQYGFSQRQVAKKIGVSASIISGYETGERTPSTEALMALADLYHCSTDYLLGMPQNSPKLYLDTDGLSAEQFQAIQAIVELLKK